MCIIFFWFTFFQSSACRAWAFSNDATSLRCFCFEPVCFSELSRFDFPCSKLIHCWFGDVSPVPFHLEMNHQVPFLANLQMTLFWSLCLHPMLLCLPLFTGVFPIPTASLCLCVSLLLFLSHPQCVHILHIRSYHMLIGLSFAATCAADRSGIPILFADSMTQWR